MALGRTVAGEIVRRSGPVPTPLRRGAAAVVVTGGALSLAGVAATIPLQVDAVQVDPSVVAAAAVLPVGESTAADPPAGEPDSAPPTLVPVASDVAAGTEQLDTAKLVKAVQLAEREITGGGKDPDAGPDGGDTPKGADPEADDPEAGDYPAGDAKGGDEKAGDEKDRAGDAAATEPTGRAKASGSTNCGLDTSQLGAVKPHVRSAANFLGCGFGEPTVLGVAGRAGNSDHPSGKALDFMVDRATGNALAACALRNQEALGVSYVIWRQRINFGSGWKPMEDRGGATANHLDHVHVSFESGAGGRPSAC